MVVMTPLAADLLILLRRDLRCLAREVALFPDDLALWRTVPGIANSAGNLALHVAGNATRMPCAHAVARRRRSANVEHPTHTHRACARATP